MPVEDDDDLPGEVAAPPKKAKPKPPVATVPEEVEDPEPPAPKKHVHTEYLALQAKRFGITQRDLDNHPSAVIWEEINRAIALAAAHQPAAASAVKQPEPEDDVEAFLKTCEDEATAKMIRALAARADTKAIHEKLSKLDQLEANEKARQDRNANEMVDTAFAALPEEFKALIGEGDMAELTDPGARGWRAAIYKEAGIDTTKQSQRAVNARVLAAATALAKDKLKPKKKPAEGATDYDEEPPARKTTPKHPVNGRFTTEQFEAGQLVRPNGKKTGIDQLSPVDGMRRILKEAGDPRGDRPVIDFDEDLPE